MNLLNGRDVLAVLPTGFGKSLINGDRAIKTILSQHAE